MTRAGMGLLLLLWAASSVMAQVFRVDVVARKVTDSSVVRIEFDDVALASLIKNRLTIVYRDLDFKVPLDSLSKIRVVRRSGFLGGAKKGALIGGVAGALIGGALGWESAKSGEKFQGLTVGALGWGAAFAVVGGIIGGTVRKASGRSLTTYDFRKMERSEQIETINRLLEEVGNKKAP